MAKKGEREEGRREQGRDELGLGVLDLEVALADLVLRQQLRQLLSELVARLCVSNRNIDHVSASSARDKK